MHVLFHAFLGRENLLLDKLSLPDHLSPLLLNIGFGLRRHHIFKPDCHQPVVLFQVGLHFVQRKDLV